MTMELKADETSRVVRHLAEASFVSVSSVRPIGKKDGGSFATLFT